MNILITGGAGFIGYFLAHYHAQLKDKVFILDNFFKSQGDGKEDLRSSFHGRDVHIYPVDLTKSIPPLDTPFQWDIVYHLAAINGTQLFYEIPYQVAYTNVKSTLNLLDWLESKSVGRLIYTSSSEVYSGA